jgi:hypothetical protein
MKKYWELIIAQIYTDAGFENKVIDTVWSHMAEVLSNVNLLHLCHLSLQQSNSVLPLYYPTSM